MPEALLESKPGNHMRAMRLRAPEVRVTQTRANPAISTAAPAAALPGGAGSQRIGYARVSSLGQNLDSVLVAHLRATKKRVR
jgi:hypothetical protein